MHSRVGVSLCATEAHDTSRSRPSVENMTNKRINRYGAFLADKLLTSSTHTLPHDTCRIRQDVLACKMTRHIQNQDLSH